MGKIPINVEDAIKKILNYVDDNKERRDLQEYMDEGGDFSKHILSSVETVWEFLEEKTPKVKLTNIKLNEIPKDLFYDLPNGDTLIIPGKEIKKAIENAVFVECDGEAIYHPDPFIPEECIPVEELQEGMLNQAHKHLLPPFFREEPGPSDNCRIIKHRLNGRELEVPLCDLRAVRRALCVFFGGPY